MTTDKELEQYLSDGIAQLEQEYRKQIEALQADLAESRANDRQAMYYLNQVREIVGGRDFPDMVRRCEELRNGKV